MLSFLAITPSPARNALLFLLDPSFLRLNVFLASFVFSSCDLLSYSVVLVFNQCVLFSLFYPLHLSCHFTGPSMFYRNLFCIHP